jgi:YHS domain-containing protein
MAKLNITELDFENSKQQLKNYLKGQTRYKDYDFDGSNLSVLMDVLSYNTYQNNFYTNMAMNEMFIDSAVLRNSVISHAKELNYLPRSRTSARAIVNVTINDDTVIGQTITIEENAAFTTSYLGVNYEFVSDKAYVARKTAPGVFVAENVEIFEGQMLTSFEREV